MYLIFPIESCYVAVGQCYRMLLAFFLPPHSTCRHHNTESQQLPEGTPDKRLGCPPGNAFQCERMMFVCLAMASVSLQMQEQIVLFLPLRKSVSACVWLIQPCSVMVQGSYFVSGFIKVLANSIKDPVRFFYVVQKC